MKKLLSIIAATALITTAGSTLVSCGISNAKLLAKKINTKEYKGFMQSALTTWAPGSTQQMADAYVLEQLYDGLLTPNSSGTIEGQMADWWGHNDNGDTYYFHLRDQEVQDKSGRTTGVPLWTKVESGKITGTQKVEPMDFFNAFRFDFNPNASADGSTPTNELFKHGEDLVDILQNLTKLDKEKYAEKNFGRYANNANESSPEKEYNSTQNYDTAILLINLMAAKDDGAETIEALASAGTNDARLDSFLTEVLTYNRNPQKFQELIIKSATEGGMMSVSLNKDQNGTVTETSTDEEGNGSSEHEYNIKINLQNPSTTFFESAAGYGSLKPIPSFAVSYTDKQNRSWYNYSKRYQPSKNEMWFSGAYYVKSYNASSNTVLLKNPNYYQADRVYIEKATYSLMKNASVDSNRLWFEGGDASEVAISPNDASGWKKYVGDNFNSDKQEFAFTGTHATSAIPSQATFAMFYNYGRVENGQVKTSSIALAQKSVRLYLNYFIQRSQIAVYYAGKLDNDSNTKESLAWDGSDTKNVKTRNSNLLRNTFTIPKLAVDNSEEKPGWNTEKGVNQYDYTLNNVGNKYDDIYGLENQDTKDLENPTEVTKTDEKTSEQTKYDIFVSNLSGEYATEEVKTTMLNYYNKTFGSTLDGNDAFYQNDLTALGMFLNSDGTVKENYATILTEFANAAAKSILDSTKYPNDAAAQRRLDKENELAKATILAKVVTADLKEVGITTPITLEWLLNGNLRLTLNPRVQYLVDQFNISVGEKSPIKIKTNVSADNASYSALAKSGQFDIFVNGWSPDYTDPFNFLNTLSFGSSYEAYQNLTQVFEKVDGAQTTELKIRESFKGKDNQNIEYYNTLEKNYSELLQITEEYTDMMVEAKQISTTTERLDKLSTAELYALYDKALITPLYNKNPTKTIMLSYLDPFTRSSYIAGSSYLRLFGVKMIPSLWTKEEYLEAEANFSLSINDPNKKEEYKNLYIYSKSGVVTEK
ncbi:hypothetical protein CG002_00460 [Mesoplasma florum]|uniref:oligopeptide ABC transporter substrate-binding protein OppA n=1 Tax=Mesoplasma florum TaxID=2151 RepID=UPI000D097BBD|nr:oligopeptide ABC transporter substrate-binding protein OppA [Mesoplasma florum]AVN64846.1 hypothetical protein CG002_00460 [Mesoplasma florum]